MLVIAKKTPKPSELAEWMATVPGFLESGTYVDGERTKLYWFQEAFMQSTSNFRAVLKARQVGFSFTFAAESLANAMLKETHSSIFVSFNLDDAVEKIRHAEALYESLPLAWKKRRITQNKTSLEFEDPQGHRTIIRSLPCREPRGKGKTDIYLDELPFMQRPAAIYQAALPLIARGGGRMVVGSTPLGTIDIFHDIITNTQKYPIYERYIVPWWHCPEFCRNVTKARVEAPSLTTQERVHQFGTPAIRDILNGMALDAFMQEFECEFVDDQVSYLPWEMIQKASRDRDQLPYVDDVLDLHKLAIRGPLYAGFDVGRRRNASELIVVEQLGERFQVRCMQTLDKAPFQQQFAVLSHLVAKRADLVRLCIDATGLGMQLAEDVVARYKHKAEGVNFTAALKSEMAGDLKIALEGNNLYIPADRDLMLQLHSVRKVVTTAGNIRLDSEHDEAHHADKFWALALALHAEGSKPKRTVLRAPVAGARTVVGGYTPR